MSKRRGPARSSNAAQAAFGALTSTPGGFGSPSAFSSPAASQLSYVTEPPDLTQVHDGNLVVLFKSLLKKDDTTKAKALEDLQVSFAASTDIEDPVLAAWIRLYPRLSTDTSRRVRQLAHTTHGAISQRAGRKIAKHMQTVAGAWLTGLSDSDRTASRAARDALKAVFSTDEKVAGVWRHYNAAVLEYCTNVIANESVNSLSDERQVSPEDAESKFARVIATCVLTAAHLLSILPPDELAAQNTAYTTLLSNPHIWAFTSHPDPFLRKSLYQLLTTTLQHQPILITPALSIITPAFLSALSTPQTGSVTDLLDALTALTNFHPAIWTPTPGKKRTPLANLTRFLRLGSQSAGPQYWGKVATLLSALPGEVLPKTTEAAKALLDAVVDGIRKGPEPKGSLGAAWGAYWGVCYLLVRAGVEGVVEAGMWPVFEEFLVRGKEGGEGEKESRVSIRWGGAGVCGEGIAMGGAQGDEVVEMVRGVWGRVKEVVVGKVKGDMLEVVGERWVELGVEVLKKATAGNPVVGMVHESNGDVVVACIDALVAEKGERVDVAVLLEGVLEKFGEGVLALETVQKATASFFTTQLPTLLNSPSLPHLLNALVSYGMHTPSSNFQPAWKTTIHSLLLSTLPAPQKETSISHLLISTSSPELTNKLPHMPELAHYVSTKLLAALATYSQSSWDLSTAALRSAAIAQETKQAMLTIITTPLSPKSCIRLSAVDPDVITSFSVGGAGAGLLWRVMVLMEDFDDEVVAAAQKVKGAVEKGLKPGAEGEVLDMVMECVRVPDEVTLSMQTLAAKGAELVGRGVEVERGVFGGERWEEGLKPLLGRFGSVAVSVTSVLGGGVFMVKEEQEGGRTLRDVLGYTSVLRMGFFTVEFLKAVGAFEGGEAWERISAEGRAGLLFYLSLVLELAKDNIAISGANDLWTGNSPEVEADVLDFISDTQKFIANCVKDGGATVYEVVDRLMEASREQTPRGFYAARVLAGFIAELSEHRQISAEKTQEWVKSVNVKRGTDVFRCTAILAGLAESLEAVDRLRNELASDLIGVPASKAAEEGLQKLVFLNAVLPKPGDDAVAAALPPQRAIFLVKHLLGWFEDEEFSADPNLPIISEAAKVFAGVLPVVKDLYGEHWQALCDFITNCWQMCASVGEGDIPVVFTTLKLFQTLKSLQHENDDIEDAWNNSATALYGALINLLRNSKHPDEQHLPRNLVNALMARQTRGMDLKYLEDASEIYPLLNVRSRPVQEAAFELLHRQIPAMQEQVSIDAAFSKEESFQLQLPAELLSLVMEPPTIGEVEGWGFARSMPLPLRGYLLTWILIFDHFENSSFKVKSAYVENLKEGGYLTGLFDFTFDFLGHAKGRPIDASKFEIESYTLDQESDPEKDTQWLLIHLYYLSLRSTPSLAKSWWIDCKSRQKVLSVEKFTEKYMSPLIIDKELQSVRAWIQERPALAPGEEDQEMQVKISRGAAKEVTAVYPIDDQTMEMVVRLPSTFPLKQVEVEGAKRVGLNEQQFRKMQLASQAVINFQSASIIDGLQLFHKNVQLHFDGVAECAICYSILAVTPDRALPNKACSTCKNKFHATCLLKWFKTSNSSSCPLCRTSFSFYS